MINIPIIGDLDEIILSEEEKKLILIYRTMKAVNADKNYLNEDPSQVKIHVVEEMTFGEKIGG